MGKRQKLLVVSDAPSSSTGLGRITRELCQRIYSDLSDVFELATLGTGGNVSSRFPWRQYVITRLENYTIPELPRVWNDFAGDEPGTCFFVWNPGWLWWVADPSKLGTCTLKDFLLSKRFETWIYAPIDAEGPNGKLPLGMADILARFDRTLYYTKFAADLAFKTSEKCWGDHLPHGTDTKVFFPRDREEARKTFIKRVTDSKPTPLVPGLILVGITATNTQRKDWGFALEVCGELVRRGANLGVWAHTDRLSGYWDIIKTADAFGLRGRIIPTNKFLSDEDMAWALSACDCVLGCARGEGWGLVHTEALSCGIPVIHCEYAGGAENLPPEYKVKPIGFYYDDGFLNRRPVMRVEDWADAVQRVVGTRASLPEHLSWDECWPWWSSWLKKGLEYMPEKRGEMEVIR